MIGFLVFLVSLGASLIHTIIVVVRGKGGAATSCDALLTRVDRNDPTLQELVILSNKTFGAAQVERLASALGTLSYLCVFLFSSVLQVHHSNQLTHTYMITHLQLQEEIQI